MQGSLVTATARLKTPTLRPLVLVVDDEPGIREVLEIALRRSGFDVIPATGAEAAIEQIHAAQRPFPLILTDLVMPDGSGMDVLKAARQRSEDSQVIVLTAHSSVENALIAMREGAYDFVTKPFSPNEITALAHKALEKNAIVLENKRLRAQVAAMRAPAEELFGSSPEMRDITTLLRKAAATKTTVLVTGASGTGKERCAQLLHQLSNRKSGPFCVINCGALPEALMESELFGHEKGAFTGANQAAKGLFRQAHGGTLLLDEIGELPLSLQVKLLRVLQERKVRPLGRGEEVPVDVRVLAATNRDVEAEVEAGRFRQDLYYRLNVIRIHLPPLSDRSGEVRRLAKQMVLRFAQEMDKVIEGITPEALRALEAHPFPGNIRELENTLERAAALTSGVWIDLSDLPEEIGGQRISISPVTGAELPEEGCELDEVLAKVERQLLSQALARCNGVRTSAAKLLGISFRSLRYRLTKLGLSND